MFEKFDLLGMIEKSYLLCLENPAYDVQKIQLIIFEKSDLLC